MSWGFFSSSKIAKTKRFAPAAWHAGPVLLVGVSSSFCMCRVPIFNEETLLKPRRFRLHRSFIQEPGRGKQIRQNFQDVINRSSHAGDELFVWTTSSSWSLRSSCCAQLFIAMACRSCSVSRSLSSVFKVLGARELPSGMSLFSSSAPATAAPFSPSPPMPRPFSL